MKLYNTLTRAKEDLQPGAEPLTMYVCGITPYDEAHVGHAMKDVVFDVLRRYLEYRGFTVRHVQNHTDVDDKIIARAVEMGMDPLALSERTVAAYMAMLGRLNILPAHVYPTVTGEMDAIIAMIDGLVTKGHAYAANGSVYFRVRSIDDYGKLSHRSLDAMIAGARVDPGDDKEHPGDFALWKAAKPGEPAWDSPWGAGRPGWHIECSAMAFNHLGPQIDIHGGGLDLVFPHHENEIAQSEAFTGATPFARRWVHNGLMQMDGMKMSKSLGNVILADAAIAQWGVDTLRLFILTSHYRSPINWTQDGLLAARQNAERIRAAVSVEVQARQGVAAVDPGPCRDRFVAVMDDDLNTPLAVVALFDLVKAINKGVEQGAAVAEAQATLRELAGVLGMTLAGQGTDEAGDIGPFVELLIELRRDLRAAKQYELADRVRDRLSELGIALEDGAQGTRWKRA